MAQGGDSDLENLGAEAWAERRHLSLHQLRARRMRVAERIHRLTRGEFIDPQKLEKAFREQDLLFEELLDRELKTANACSVATTTAEHASRNMPVG